MNQGVLVTGGAGFIGSHLTRELLGRGCRVIVVDNLSTGSVENLPRHKRLFFLRKDISRCCWRDIPGKVDTLIHLAATPSVHLSWSDAVEVHQNNSTATVAALELCQGLQARRFVFASSAAVYGNTRQLPIAETDPAETISPYGLQKIMSEKYIDLYARKYSFSSVVLRLFNVFGPSARMSPYSGVVSIAIKSLRQNRPVTLYGDGSQTRDFIYIKDVTFAFMRAMEASVAAGTTLVCNIAGGRAISVKELVKTLGSILDLNPTFRRVPAMPEDIRHSKADVDKAKKILGFRCRYTVESGLKDMVKSSCL